MLGDTILAQATGPGSSVRAVLRISGPAALAVAGLVFAPRLPARRCFVTGELTLRGHRLPAAALVLVGPRSFTGEDTVELQLPGSPLLLQCLEEDLLLRGQCLGLRKALPGEFTARALQHGRIDAAQAEGLLLLLHAADRAAAAQALPWLRGGMSAAIQDLRSGMQDVLALVEVGLDFTADETGAVQALLWQQPLTSLRQQLLALLAALPQSSGGGEILLRGYANVGKSALANALAGHAAALVDAQAGTTRDVLRIELADGAAVWDAPGDLEAAAGLDAAALQLRDRLAATAERQLLILDAELPRLPPALPGQEAPYAAIVFTRCDRVAAAPVLPADAALARLAGLPVFYTSARYGEGIAELRSFLLAQTGGGSVRAGAPLRAALQQALMAIEQAQQLPPGSEELVAVELQAALRALDDVDGRHSPEQLLDRIYGRFCLGK